MVVIVENSTLIGCVVGLDLRGHLRRNDKGERKAPIFKYRDRRDVGLLIDKRPNASPSRFKIKVLHSCIPIANKYGREREKSPITAKNTAQRLAA